MTDVVVLNGGSSSGKSTIARALQPQLPTPFLTFSVDDLIEAMPRSMSEEDPAGILISSDGGVIPGPEFRRLEISWNRGLAAIAGSGTGVILDDVFLGGAASQQRVREAFTGLQILWVGVRCDPQVAAAREAARGDRPTGMAASQAELVHLGVEYDLEVDSAHTSPAECARLIAARV
ncbi:MAG: chloramphenicol phosphotransferase CPT family protein [Nakamurella sp.]